MYRIQDINLLKSDAALQDRKRFVLCEQLLNAYDKLFFVRNNLQIFRERYLSDHAEDCNCYICGPLTGLNKTLEDVEYNKDK